MKKIYFIKSIIPATPLILPNISFLSVLAAAAVISIVSLMLFKVFSITFISLFAVSVISTKFLEITGISIRVLFILSSLLFKKAS